MKKIIVSFLIMACIGNTIGITANRSVQIEKEIEETERIHPSAPLATGGTALFTNSISNTLVSIEKKEIPVVTTSGENSNSCDEEHKEVEFIQYDSNQWCNIGEFKLTAYEPSEVSCGEFANGYTSTGKIATANRTIAVDPSVIPYGTEVKINDNIYIAEDCGGAIKGNRIDVFFNTIEECDAFGVRYSEVYIQKPIQIMEIIEKTYKNGNLISEEVLSHEEKAL